MPYHSGFSCNELPQIRDGIVDGEMNKEVSSGRIGTFSQSATASLRENEPLALPGAT
jgi:hypothetical protein